jgi:hypothetical protein
MPPSASVTIRPAAQLRDGRWIVRRALIGLMLIVGFAIGGAWLYHASISPETIQTDAE